MVAPNKSSPPKVLTPNLNPKNVEAPDIIARYWARFFKMHPIDVERNTKESLNWFRIQVSKTVHVKAETILNKPLGYEHTGPRANKTMIGKLYLYEYEAEQAGDAETGLYDKYPMVFFFNVSKTAEGKTIFHGLNMHYLLPKQRAILYMELMKLKTSNKWLPKTKLKLQYDLIKAASGSNLYELAVHAYRVDRIKSKMVEIPSFDWQIAVFLRLEKFIKAKDHKAGMSPSANRKAVQKKSAPLKKKMISKK